MEQAPGLHAGNMDCDRTHAGKEPVPVFRGPPGGLLNHPATPRAPQMTRPRLRPSRHRGQPCHAAALALADVLSVGALPVDSLLRMQRRVAALEATHRVMAAMIGETCLGRGICRGSPAQQAIVLGIRPRAVAAGSPAGVVATVLNG